MAARRLRGGQRRSPCDSFVAKGRRLRFLNPGGEQLGLGAVIKCSHGYDPQVLPGCPLTASFCAGRIISAGAAVLLARPTSEKLFAASPVSCSMDAALRRRRIKSRILGRQPMYSRSTPVASSSDRTKTIGAPASCRPVRTETSREHPLELRERVSAFQKCARACPGPLSFLSG